MSFSTSNTSGPVALAFATTDTTGGAPGLPVRRQIDFDTEVAQLTDARAQDDGLRAPPSSPDESALPLLRGAPIDLTQQQRDAPIVIDLTVLPDVKEEEEDEGSMDLDDESIYADSSVSEEETTAAWPENCDLGDGEGMWIEETPEGPEYVGEYMDDPDYVDIKLDPRVQTRDARLPVPKGRQLVPDAEIDALKVYGEPFQENYYKKGGQFRRFF